MPAISVIVPIYNAEKYLKNSLDSILEQTLKDIEIICINDGSTDGSLSILESYAAKDSRIILITQENAGVAQARNVGLKQATGQWIAFCDSDDTLPANALKILYSKSSNVDIVLGEYEDCSDSGKVLHRKYPKHTTNFFQLLFMSPCLWNKLIRRDFVEEQNLFFSQDVLVGEDVRFLAKLAECYPRWKLVRKKVYCHWSRNYSTVPSLNHRYSLEFFKSHMACRDYLLSLEWPENLTSSVEQYVYINLTPFLVEFLFRMINFEERRKAFLIFKNFILKYDWTNKEQYFESFVCVPHKHFISMEPDFYFSTASIFDYAEKVKSLYEIGMMGASYIVLYVKLWFKFKLTQNLKRKKL